MKLKLRPIEDRLKTFLTEQEAARVLFALEFTKCLNPHIVRHLALDHIAFSYDEDWDDGGELIRPAKYAGLEVVEQK